MATKRQITKKAIPQGAVVPQKEIEPLVEKAPQAASGSEGSSKFERSKKVCSFCQNKTNPSYTDLANLKRFLTDRAKIVGKTRTGICSKHQRAISRNIKYARHLALLPFVPKV